LYTKNWRRIGSVKIVSQHATDSYWPKADGLYDSLAKAVERYAWRHGEDSIYRLKYGWLTYHKWESYEPPHYRELFCVKGDDAVFIDECGLIIPPWRVIQEYNNLPKSKKRSYRRHWRGGRYVFRRGPVEGIRKWRGGTWLRGPRTLQENREANFFFEHDEEARDYKIKGRAHRSKLPTLWDDRCRSNYGVKNWKQYRKHQWKE